MELGEMDAVIIVRTKKGTLVGKRTLKADAKGHNVSIPAKEVWPEPVKKSKKAS